MKPTQEQLDRRFWTKVEKGPGCWIWTAGKTAAGYGLIRINTIAYYAHRLAYEIHHGEIPQGLVIDHSCHQRACVNPAHLRLADYSQNNENRPYENVTGYRGVSQNRCGRGQLIQTWSATVWDHGKRHRLGAYPSPEEAAAVAREWRLRLHTHNDHDRRAS